MPTKSIFREYFEALLIAAIFLGFSNNFVVKTFFIPSGSMEDTLLIGDHLFVNRYMFGTGSDLERRLTPKRDIRRGDVVIFRSTEDPRNDLVKRCIGLPGDKIALVKKELFVNDKKVDDSLYAVRRDERTFPNQRYLSRQARLRDTTDPVLVPEGEFFFLGDNRDYSHDSRYWGTVPRHFIKGRAFLVYWSNGGETSDGQWRTWRHKLTQVSGTLTGFLSNTRWNRTFHLIR